MARRKPTIPRFRSDRGEREFLARESVESYAPSLQDLDVEIRPARTEQIAIRLRKEDLAELRKLAEARGVGHTTLARRVIEAWLDRSRRRPGASGARR